jgi:uncharacterized protein (TIGR02118 family)
MYKAVGIWSWPSAEDVEAFEDHYASKHYVAATKLPGVAKITLVTGGDDAAREADIYRIAEVYWADADAFAAAAESPEWAAMVEDATWMMERFGVTLKSAHGIEQVDDR